MKLILGLIVLVLAFFVMGYFFKKKRYSDIDRLEEWKINVIKRPVLEELTKVKQLNMTGETEELFEKWRNEWDEIVTVQMPDVEELLFDAEEYIDRYRFQKSKEIQDEIASRLQMIESDIERIIEELNNLVGSEEQNRIQIEEEKEKYRIAKKTLLAHRHSFGKAAAPLEKQLDEVAESFALYEETTGGGNYLQAREIVLKLQSRMNEINEKIQRIPDLIVLCNTSLPNEISELKDGYQEMIDRGYILNHFDFEKQAAEMEKQLEVYKSLLDSAELEEVDNGIEEMKDNINALYDLYEQEVTARGYYASNSQKLEESLNALAFENDKLKAEIITIQTSYHISEEELKIQKDIEKQLSTVAKRYELLKAKVVQQDTAYSVLAAGMKEMEAMLAEAEEEYKVLSKKIRELRQDELSARDKINKLHIQLQQAAKWLVKHNVPGVPENYSAHLADTKSALEDVAVKLEEKPLNMTSVQIFLDKAVQSANEFTDRTKELIEHMLLTEKVIQYTNRYRRQYPEVQEALVNAEEKFRRYDYASALEEAAKALEKVEPGALKEIAVDLEYEDKD